MSEARRLRYAVLALGAILLTGAILSGCSRGASTVSPAVMYQCPMHPTYVSDRPGDCPICGMAPGSDSKEDPLLRPRPPYTCPMHPAVFSGSPGRCPQCGMDLVPVRNGNQKPPNQTVEPARPSQAQAAPTTAERSTPGSLLPQPDGPAGHLAGAGEGLDGYGFHPGVRGRGRATGRRAGHGPPSRSRRRGCASPASRRPRPVSERLVRSIRTVGTVMADETRIQHIHTKIPGWVEALTVNFTGQMVRQGEPVLSLYSPELLASQEEFLRAREVASRFAGSDLPEVRKGGEDLVQAARRRLQLLDVPESLIAELERTGKPQRAVTLTASVSGFVTAKSTFVGAAGGAGHGSCSRSPTCPGSGSRPDFYEYEAQSLKLGQVGRLTLAYEPAKTLTGRVTYLYPTLNLEAGRCAHASSFPIPASR